MRPEFPGFLFRSCIFSVLRRYFPRRSSALRVQINNEVIELFEGARVKDAVRKYSRTDLNRIESNTRKIVDRYGNRLALDGELSDGDDFYIRDCP
jgi:hypothetical protein